MIKIEAIKLLKGSHEKTAATGQGCFMNVIAYLNGEAQITDQSTCVCPTIKPIAIFLNDFANNEERQRLLQFIPRALGSATDDREVVERRLVAVVKYAEFNARLADGYAKSAESAESAKSAAKSAKSAAKSAKSAVAWAAWALRAKSMAESAKSAAKASAAWAASAESAAWATWAEPAESLYLERRETIFQAGLDLLNEICPPLEALDQCILERVVELQTLQSVHA